MIEQIRTFLKSLASCPQLAKIYLFNHPEVERAIIKAHEDLQNILRVQPELLIAIVDQEIASGDDIFFDLSKQLSAFVELLKEKRAEKIFFHQGIDYQEFLSFVRFFIDPSYKQKDVQNYLTDNAISHIIVDTIRSENDGFDDEKRRDELKLEGRYADFIGKISSSITDIVENKTANFANFYFVMDSFMKGIGAHYQEILKLVKIKEKDAVTFSHLLNVSFLAIYFSQSIGFNKEESRNLGIAGLFHDIGKLYISNSLLKGGKLTEVEFEGIKSHSLLGSKILLTYTDKIGVLAPVVAFEHHLKYDGSGGYPQMKYPHPLHLGSMMISLCDVYDALSQRRSYKRDYPPEQIYQIMKGGRGTQFHPELFDAFFDYMGVWPNGTIVLLSNQKVGVVKKQNRNKIYSPFVEILSDQSHDIINLMQKTDLQIKKSLNPYSEGQEYMQMSENNPIDEEINEK